MNGLAWWEEYDARFEQIAGLVRRSGARLSTHPGQYTVLSSERPEVVEAAVAELEYQNRLLDSFGVDASHKIVLHVGSVGAVRSRVRPAERRCTLATRPRERRADCSRSGAALAERIGVPVVLDVFHHRLAPSLDGLSIRELVVSTAETWKEVDGRQKIHFSTQAPGKRPGAHAETIDLDAFTELVHEVGDLPLDCMLEVKDKEQSVLRARKRIASAILRSRPRSSVDRAAVS